MTVSRHRAAFAVATALVALVAAPPARAAVTLTLSDKDATPTATLAAPGTNFPVSVFLTSTTSTAADTVASVDYTLHGNTNGIFSIVSRNSSTGAFADPLVADASVAGLAISTNNTNNLGAGLATGQSPVSNNTFLVADFSIRVAPNTPAGTYTLSVAANPPGIGYVDAGDNEHAYTTLGSFLVTVPEPTSLAACTLALLPLLSRHRRPTRA